MCEETDREGRGLENKWIYVFLLFIILGGQRDNLNAQRPVLFRIKWTALIVALRVNSDESA